MGMSDKGQLPKVLSARSKYGTPTVPIIVGYFAVLVGCSFDFSSLLSMVNILYIFSQFMQIAALVKLRMDRPNMVRPWQVNESPH
jgi:amino acid transporter